MPSDDRQSKQQELEAVRVRAAELERELADEPQAWRASGYYTAYYATSGFILGGIAAGASLLLNIVGAAMNGLHPLQLIRVYLTFPLGERALDPAFDSGIALAIGCCLYIATGMLLGVPVYLALTRLAGSGSLGKRMGIATLIGLAIWVINFYGILSWLQPLLFGGNWIVSLIPPWVAALTHLVFAWTMALLYPWGLYTPYQPPTARTPGTTP